MSKNFEPFQRELPRPLYGHSDGGAVFWVSYYFGVD
jgi:hypothetical protein